MKSESHAYDNWCGQFVKPEYDPENNERCRDLLREFVMNEISDWIAAGDLDDDTLSLIHGISDSVARTNIAAKYKRIARRANDKAKRHWETTP